MSEDQAVFKRGRDKSTRAELVSEDQAVFREERDKSTRAEVSERGSSLYSERGGIKAHELS